MTDDKICVFKDSDLKNFGKSICEINIEEREIKNIDSHRKDDPSSLWLKNIVKRNMHLRYWLIFQMITGMNLGLLFKLAVVIKF